LYKIFATTSFIGKNNIFLSECHSTNDELSKIVQEKKVEEGFVLYTDHQISGKGQRGNTWLDEKGKSILMSIYLKPSFLPINNLYFLYIISALSVLNTVKKNLTFPEAAKIKWPNDIMIGKKKLAGILIENIFKGKDIESVLIGIGLNVNQMQLPETAISVFEEIGVFLERKILLESILMELETNYLMLKQGEYQSLITSYHSNLFWINEEKYFRTIDGKVKGSIKGVDKTGNLIVDINGIYKSFQIKEIEFLIDS